MSTEKRSRPRPRGSPRESRERPRARRVDVFGARCEDGSFRSARDRPSHEQRRSGATGRRAPRGKEAAGCRPRRGADGHARLAGRSRAMTPITFTVMGKSEPAGSKRAFNWRAKDGRSGTSFVDANPKSRSWKTQVSEAAADSYSGELLDGPLSVEFTFEVPRPQGHFGKRGLLTSAPAHPTTRPDVLKLARAVEEI